MKIPRRKFTVSGVFLVAIAAFVGLGAFVVDNLSQNTYAASDKGRLITVYDRGLEQVFLSEAENVEEALVEAGFELDSRDAVEPAREEALVATDYKINIYRARPVTVVDGAMRQKVMTPFQTPERIAADAGVELYPEDIVEIGQSDDLLNDGAGLQLTVDRAVEFTFDLYGKKTKVRTQAGTVGEMLKEKDITLGANDKVFPATSAKITADTKVRVWREGVQTITVDEDIDFEVEKIQDADREIGYREVKTPGVKGERTVTYEVKIENGKEVSRKEIASITIKPAVKQVEIVGAKSNYSDSLEEWLYALRMCETTNRYDANTGNGFYGAYQFMIPTWDNIARITGRTDLIGVRPDLASPADQDAMVIANTNATAGLSTQHPGCYKKLGLSNKPPAN